MILKEWIKRRIPGPWRTQAIIRDLTRVSKEILAEHKTQRKILNDIKSELVLAKHGHLTSMHVLSTDLRRQLHSWLDSYQMNMLETIHTLRQHRMSLARFGDGELRLMFRYDSAFQFQKSSFTVANDLREVLTFTGYDPNLLLVALPDRMRSSPYWNSIWADFWPDLQLLLRTDVRYGNSHVSRPEAFAMFRDRAVSAWRELWDSMNICIITGAGSRFNLIEALFSNVGSLQYVFSTPTNAHSDSERLVSEVEASVRHDRLCLISLGPAGTVLAAKLAMRGYWAVDIGHLSASFTQVFDGGPSPESLPLVNNQ